MGAGDDRQRPGKAPAVAVEHRQRPQIDRMLAHAAGDDVGHRQQISAAVMIDDAFGIAGGAGGVIERDGVPFVGRHQPGEIGIAVAQKILVVEIAEPFAGAGEFRIVIVDDERLRLAERQRVLHHFGEFAVDDQHLGFAVVEREGDDRGIEPRIDGIEHRAGHRHAVMRFEHRRHVGQHRRDGVAALDAAFGQRRGEPSRARIELAVGPRPRAVNDRGLVRIDLGGARQKRQRRERLKIRRVAVEIGVVGRRHGFPPCCFLKPSKYAKRRIANGEWRIRPLACRDPPLTFRCASPARARPARSRNINT